MRKSWRRRVRKVMTDYEQILEIVRQWRPDQRLSLLRDVLETLSTTAGPLRSPRDTLSKALGLVPSEGHLSSDEEVKRLLDEHRMEKYG